MALAELDRGCHGVQVRLLQRLLNTAPHQRPRLRPDGLFGLRTEEKVRGYQGGHALTVDGIVGARTWAALELKQQELPTSSATSAPTPARPIGAGRPHVAAPARPLAPPRPVVQPRPIVRPRSVPMPVVADPVHTAHDAPWMATAEAEKWVMEHTTKGTKRMIEYHATTLRLSQRSGGMVCVLRELVLEAGSYSRHEQRGGGELGSLGNRIDRAALRLHRAASQSFTRSS